MFCRTATLTATSTFKVWPVFYVDFPDQALNGLKDAPGPLTAFLTITDFDD